VDVNLAGIMGGRRRGPKRLGWDPGLDLERGVLLPPGRIKMNVSLEISCVGP